MQYSTSHYHGKCRRASEKTIIAADIILIFSSTQKLDDFIPSKHDIVSVVEDRLR
jgi:hypothetical protein